MSLIKTYTTLKLSQWAVIITFWVFLSVVTSSQLYFTSLKNGLEPIWSKLFVNQLPIWLLWAILSPTVVYIVNKYPLQQGKYLKTLGLYVIIGLIIIMVLSNLTLFYLFEVYGYLDLKTASLDDYLPYLMSRLSNDLMIYIFLVFAVLFIRNYAIRKNEALNSALLKIKNDQLKHELTQTQLQALKLQLNPHFLFNTLNTISSLTLLGNKSVSIDMTSNLGNFLRRTLEYGDRQMVTLKKELEFFDLYLAIEAVRFKDKLVLHKQIDPTLLDKMVPNLILQPLIENAIKYGISQLDAPGVVELKIYQKSEHMIVEMYNDCPARATLSQRGVGLSNIESRLEKLYGADYSFKIETDHNNQGVIASIVIPETFEINV